MSTLNAFTLAVTVNVPPMPLAVSAGAVALPLALVRIGIGGVALNVPLAPLAPGVTVNVTGDSLKGVAVGIRYAHFERRGKRLARRCALAVARGFGQGGRNVAALRHRDRNAPIP